MASTTRTGTPFTQVMNETPLRTFQFVTVAVCMLILVCDGIDLQLLGIVAPLVMDDFGVERGPFGIAMSAALVGFGLGAWAGGWLGDAIGRRYTLAIAALVFSLATIGAGTASGTQLVGLDSFTIPLIVTELQIGPLKVAEGVWEMAFWRLIGGLGFGGAYANALAMAGEWLPDRWRPVAVSTLSVGTPIGGTIVGWIGPDLAAERGWDGTFVFFGLATLVMVVVTLIALRDSPSFLLALGKKEQAQKNSLLILSEERELAPERHDTDTGDGPSKGVLDPGNMRLNIGVAIAFTAAALVAYSILSWSTTFLTTAGFTLNEAGNAVSIAGITSMVGSILVGIFMRQFGSRIVMIGLGITLTAIIIWLGMAVEALPEVPSSGDKNMVTALVGASGALFSAGIAGMYVIMTAGYPQSCRSAGIGFGIFMSRIGAVGATAFGGALLEMGGTSVVPLFVVLTIASLAILIGAFVIDRHVPPLAKA